MIMNPVEFKQFYFSLACKKDSNQILFNANDIFIACLKFWNVDEFKSMVFKDIYEHADDSNFPLELHKAKIMLYLSSKTCSQYLPADFTDLLFEMIYLWTYKDSEIITIKNFVFKRAVVDFKRHNPRAWCFDADESIDSNSNQFFVNKSIRISNNGNRIFINVADLFNAFSISRDEVDSFKMKYLDWLDRQPFSFKNFDVFNFIHLNRNDFVRLIKFFSTLDGKKDLALQIFKTVENDAVNLYQKQFPNLSW